MFDGADNTVTMLGSFSGETGLPGTWTRGAAAELLLSLLKWDSYGVKFIIFKCTIQWVLVYSQGSTTITTIQFQNICISPKRNQVPICTHSPSSCSPPPPPRQRLTYFLSLWICLFQTFHLSGVLQFMAFWVWLLSFSVMFARVDPSLCGQTTFHSSTHQLKDIWLFPLIG